MMSSSIVSVLPPYLAGQTSRLLVGMVIASGENHLRTLNLVQDLQYQHNEGAECQYFLSLTS